MVKVVKDNYYDFKVKQGADWNFEINGFDEDVSTTNFVMEIRKEADKNSVLLFDVKPYITRSTNKIVVNVPFEETKSFDFDKGYYDLFKGGEFLIGGKVLVTRQVTNRD